MKYLRFESEQAMLDAFDSLLVDDLMPQYVGLAAVDVVGIVYVPTGATVEHPVLRSTPELAPAPGWYVNLSESIPGFEEFEIPAPPYPTQVFAEEPARIPSEVNMAQCRLALFDKHGIESDEDFYALADVLPEEDRARARLELRTRPTVRRDNPLVQLFGATKGWDLDELFIYAGTL